MIKAGLNLSPQFTDIFTCLFIVLTFPSFRVSSTKSHMRPLVTTQPPTTSALTTGTEISSQRETLQLWTWTLTMWVEYCFCSFLFLLSISTWKWKEQTKKPIIETHLGCEVWDWFKTTWTSKSSLVTWHT